MEEHRDYKWPETQVTLRFDRAMYTQFKAGCLVRNTSPNRLIWIWMQRQVEAWNTEMPKHVIPQEDTNGRYEG